MRRAWLLWMTFAGCLLLGLGAMAWISMTIVRLDRQALLEENVRLALWRMDSTLAPLLAQETAQPYFAYQAMTPIDQAYSKMFAQLSYGDVLSPSPLLNVDSPLVKVHFQFAPDGSISSPQAPPANMRSIALRYTTTQRVGTAQELLARLQQMNPKDALADKLPQSDAEPAPLATMTNPAYANNAPIDNSVQQQQAAPLPDDGQGKQRLRSQAEFQARSNNSAYAQNFELANRRQLPLKSSERVREGIMQPLWIGDDLFLARRVDINGRQYIQGAWLDWPKIQQSLLENIRDLLPQASLTPAQSSDDDPQPRLLASLPVRLAPGNVLPESARGSSPIRVALIVGWICLITGALAIGGLLFGTVRLSERRAAFVSAVTHELRTPLTTVSMYAEMLQEGMVEENSRTRYLATLRGEAERLGHLVENVLAYSRLERGGKKGRIQTLTIAELLGSMRDRLEERSRQAGLELISHLPGQLAASNVRADASAVEQILFNLVDNAGKYASSGADHRLDLYVERDGPAVLIRLRDHGPGISPKAARALFKPFSKSVTEAAESAPGVGLGLALSRRLAREMNGDLRLDNRCNQGACFILSLPAVP